MSPCSLWSNPAFAAWGDATRLRLIVLLCAGGAASITQLTASTDVTRQAVTNYLQVLLIRPFEM